jgi:lactoylglutathione lyase
MYMTAPLELGICVSDLPRMLAFYEGVLGLKRISEIALNDHGARISGLGEQGYTVVRLQTDYGERIKLMGPNSAPTVPVAATTPSSRAGIGYITFLVRGLATEIERLGQAGYPSQKGIVELRPGVNMALVRDPEGNFIELAEYANIDAYRPDLKRGVSNQKGNT